VGRGDGRGSEWCWCAGERENWARRQGHGQDCIGEAVIPEDLGEADSQDAAYAPFSQHPHRGFAGTAAPKVRAGYQDFGIAELRLVEHEIGTLTTCIIVAPVREQLLRKV